MFLETEAHLVTDAPLSQHLTESPNSKQPGIK